MVKKTRFAWLGAALARVGVGLRRRLGFKDFTDSDDGGSDSRFEDSTVPDAPEDRGGQAPDVRADTLDAGRDVDATLGTGDADARPSDAEAEAETGAHPRRRRDWPA